MSSHVCRRPPGRALCWYISEVDISRSASRYDDGEIILVLEVQLSATAPRRRPRLAVAVMEYDIGNRDDCSNSEAR